MADKKSWVIAAFGFVLLCCDNDGSYIGAQFKGSQEIDIAFTDTASMKTSTVLLDSLPTSGTGTVLIGTYNDDVFGKIESIGYVQLYNESAWYVDADAIYDSASVLLPYSGYWYGDTTETTTIEVRQVMEDFVARSLPAFWRDEGLYSYFNGSNGLYNTSELLYNRDILSTKSFRPRPNVPTDTIRARIDETTGKAWLAEAKKSINYFKSNIEFQNYFKGIAIKAVAGGSVTGINASGITLRIYYREHESEVLVNKFYDINYASYWQYNRFKGNRSNTILSSLSPDNDIISSVELDNKTFIQSGLGVMTKIEFPYIKDLLDLNESILLNSAELVIVPVHNTFTLTYPLPETLALYQTNDSNKPFGPLYRDYSTTEQTASISFDDEFGKTSGYKFMITEYIQSLIDRSGEESETRALLLGTPLNELRNSVSRACLGGNDHEDYKIKLNVYFTYKK